MVAVMFDVTPLDTISFTAALVLMGASLTCLVLEIRCSGGALQILLNRVERD
jgi:hypothetical protein